MAQKGVQLVQETISCSICLDLLKDPVTIPCGHSYCMNCIQNFWDGEEQKKMYSCPQCRQTFTPRPVLMKSTMLAALVEELKKTGLQAAPADHCYAGPEDVACDVCTGRKLKAFMFCRTDRQSICYLCSVEEHKGHDTVSAAAERTKKQKNLKMSRLNIKLRIQSRQKDVRELKKRTRAINTSADKAVKDSEKMFTEMIRLLQKRSSDVKQQIRSKQETEVRRARELQEKLEQQITQLRRKDGELEQLSRTQDHNQFLHNYPSVSAPSECPRSPSIDTRPLSYFEDVTAAVSEIRQKLQDVLTDDRTNVSVTGTEVDDSLPQPEPKTRAGFLKYSKEITLDPNTANEHLVLSEGNRKVTLMRHKHSYSDHPDRFSDKEQVLSTQRLTGPCYWEVEGRGVKVAVAYKDISRCSRWSECLFGQNDKSWALDCYEDSCAFWFDNIQTPVSGPRSSRVGVYLDHSAGILSFYSVSETMTLLHRVQTTFTQPLHAGLYIHWRAERGRSAEFCKLK